MDVGDLPATNHLALRLPALNRFRVKNFPKLRNGKIGNDVVPGMIAVLELNRETQSAIRDYSLVGTITNIAMNTLPVLHTSTFKGRNITNIEWLELRPIYYPE